jgi:hypothetical protein
MPSDRTIDYFHMMENKAALKKEGWASVCR